MGKDLANMFCAQYYLCSSAEVNSEFHYLNTVKEENLVRQKFGEFGKLC